MKGKWWLNPGVKPHALIVSFETLLTPSWEARSGLHSPQLWRAGGGGWSQLRANQPCCERTHASILEEGCREGVEISNVQIDRAADRGPLSRRIVVTRGDA